MLKPDSLRAHLTAAIAELARNPDQLLVFIDRGAIVSTGVPGLSFEYRYTLNLILTDCTVHPDTIMVPLLAWLAVHQPELLANPDRRGQIAFEADILDNDRIDLDIKIPLTERVGVHPLPDGGHSAEHYPEPPVMEPYLQAGHWQLYVKGELVAEWNSPPA